jgi:phosphate transport system substrate-binding protein
MLNKKFAAMLDIVGFLSVASIPIFALPLLNSASQAQSAASPSGFIVPSSLPADTKINIDGSNSMAILDQALSQDFKKKFAGSNVTLSNEGTNAAIEKLEQGKVDLASIGRALTPEEKAQGLSATSIGREKIAIVVGSENPFRGNITFAQFAKLFRGEITDWSELGGQPGPIRFIDRPETSDTRQAFRNYPVFNQAEFVAGSNTETLTEDSTDAMVAKLGKDGIGYAIAHQVLNRPGVQVISMHKTLPDDPRYPFSQPRGFAYKGTPKPAVQAFLGFTAAPEGQESLRTAQANGFKAEGIAASSGSGAAIGGGAIAPSASPKIALVPSADTDTSAGGIPWWPWLLLGVPLAGGLLWGLTRGKGDAAGASSSVAVPPLDVPPVEPIIFPDVPDPQVSTPPVSMPSVEPIVPSVEPAAAGLGGLGAGIAAGLGVAGLGAAGLAAGMGVGAARKNRIVLSPRNHEEAYAYWEVSEADKNVLRQQGGQTPVLKIHDVTDVEAGDDQTTHGTQRYDWDEQSHDRHVAIPAANRDYVAELGYDTADGRWLKLARSLPVRVHAAPTVNPINPIVGGAAIAGAAAIPGTDAWGRLRPTDDTVVLEPDEEDTPLAAPPTADTLVLDPDEEDILLATPAIPHCSITTLNLNLPQHVYGLDFAAIEQLKQAAVSKTLETGEYLCKIRSGGFGYEADASMNEPWVLLWIHGGRVINKKTGKEVISTWSSLNGYDEVLSLDVLEETTLSAFFIDTAIDDNQGEVSLAVVKL